MSGGGVAAHVEATFGDEGEGEVLVCAGDGEEEVIGFLGGDEDFTVRGDGFEGGKKLVYFLAVGGYLFVEEKGGGIELTDGEAGGFGEVGQVGEGGEYFQVLFLAFFEGGLGVVGGGFGGFFGVDAPEMMASMMARPEAESIRRCWPMRML